MVKICYKLFQAILAALDRDTNDMNLAAVCPTSDSYGVGKSISMAARLASISRAFNTDHYQTIDPVIRSCLDKWLRINGESNHTFLVDSQSVISFWH